MKKLNLTEFLISLGSQILSDIYGKERLQTIIDTIDTKFSERKIVGLLKSRYGTQIFSNKVKYSWGRLVSDQSKYSYMQTLYEEIKLLNLVKNCISK